jgi:hypothetical protein
VVYVHGVNVTALNSEFSGNVAVGSLSSGGGLSVSQGAAVHIDSCVVRDNAAGTVGGLEFGDSVLEGTCDVDVVNSAVHGNVGGSSTAAGAQLQNWCSGLFGVRSTTVRMDSHGLQVCTGVAVRIRSIAAFVVARSCSCGCSRM